MSPANPITSPPGPALMRATASSTDACSRPLTITRAPSWASAVAMACPMPAVLPEMNASLPVSFRSMLSSSSGCDQTSALGWSCSLRLQRTTSCRPSMRRAVRALRIAREHAASLAYCRACRNSNRSSPSSSPPCCWPRRRGASARPIRSFLAVGGALLAFVPGAPRPSLPPELVLALFVAPVLLDAAYDASLRDLRDNWAPVAGLVVVAVGLTTAAVAVVAHALVPALPWAAAIALGAIVAPPDAVAATAVLRPLHPPQRILDDPRRRKPAERRERAADLPPGRGRGGGRRLLGAGGRADLPARRARQPGRRARRSAGSMQRLHEPRAARPDGHHPAVRRARSPCGCSPSTSACRAC